MADGLSTSLNNADKETVTMRLPSGEEVDAIIPAGLSDDQAKSLMRMKRPDLFGAPAGIPHPTTQTIGDQMVREQQSAGLAGVPGGSSAPQPASDRYTAAVGIPLGGAAAVMGGAVGAAALPLLKRPVMNAVKSIPTIAAMEGINYARQHLPLGKYIPPGAEWLPVFMHGGRGAAAEAEAGAAKGEIAPPSTDQLPNRPYMPNPRYAPSPAPAEPIPPRSGLQLSGEVAAQPAIARATSAPTRSAVEQQLNEAMGGQPLQRGVPLRNQPGFPGAAAEATAASVPQGFVPVQSSALKAYKYDPVSRELESITRDGTRYVHGDISPEDMAAFEAAPSKGAAWNQLKASGTLVGKFVSGQRVNVKPSSLRDALIRKKQ